MTRPDVPRTIPYDEVRAGLVAMGIDPEKILIRRITIEPHLIEIDAGISTERQHFSIIILPPEGK